MAGLATSLGAGAASNSFIQIADADTLLVIGSNTTESHPVVSYHLKKALRRGARLIVADPRRIELVKWADVWLNLRPGTNIALMNGLIHIILREGWEDKEFIQQRTEGFDDLRTKVQEYPPEKVEEITGVRKESLYEAARLYAEADRGMILYGLGVSEHRTGTEGAMAIANLALVCGHFGRPSTGVNTLRGQNNVQGASDLALPHKLPGYQDVTDPDVRERFGKAWGVDILPEPGFKSVEMLDEALKGNFKGLLIMGEDEAQTDPNTNRVKRALGNLEFLVVIDIFHTETTKFAHVILPGASFAEKDGTFTNGERRVQRVRKAIEPLAGMAEWQIISRLSTLMGYPMHYSHPSEIMDEIASLVPSYGGINYERLEQGGIQWPCPTKDHPGTETLYTESFLRKGGRALFVSLDQKGPGEVPDEDYPFMLITGRRREHYNNGSMTRRSSGIMELVPDEMLEINPEDAEVLNIRDGEMVRVTSRRGWIDVRARITERSQKGNLFLTFHFPEANSNVLTTDVRDPITGTPEYKCTAVRVERL